MRKTATATSWVVYKVTIHGKLGEINAVCEQGEWEQMELDRPGYHVLVRDRITTEHEAETLARAGSGYVDGPARSGKYKKPAQQRGAASEPLARIPGIRR